MQLQETNYGFELELLWVINNKLEVSSSLGILETELQKFSRVIHTLMQIQCKGHFF